jgi:hypothetical protein
MRSRLCRADESDGLHQHVLWQVGEAAHSAIRAISPVSQLGDGYTGCKGKQAQDGRTTYAVKPNRNTRKTYACCRLPLTDRGLDIHKTNLAT